jgi:hypothetical protein
MTNWAQNRRLDYIDWRIATAGEFERDSAARLFDVSPGIISGDLTLFQSLYPDALNYDKSAKRYVPAKGRYRRRRTDAWTKAIDWTAAEHSS